MPDECERAMDAAEPKAELQTVKSLPKELQPRARLLKYGPQALSDEEVVAILLKAGVHGCNVLELSRRFCAALEHGLPQLSGRVPVTLTATDGSIYEPPVGEGPYGTDEYAHLKASCESLRYLNRTHIRTLRVAQELGRRIYLPDDTHRHTPILRASQAAEVFSRHLEGPVEQTQWWVLFVDGRRVPLGTSQPLEGVPTEKDGRMASYTEMRTFIASLLRWAVIIGARGIFIAHCNAGGGLSHTKNDIRLTEQLVLSAELIRITVHDHLIIDRSDTTPNYASFRAGEVCTF